MSSKRDIVVCICGSPDFSRRMAAAIRLSPTISDRSLVPLAANYATARSVIFTERPDILILDINLRTTSQESSWIRALLLQVRERFGVRTRVVTALTSPEKFLYGGNLLFADEYSQSPSKLIDDLVVIPPRGIVGTLSLEDQIRNSIGYWADDLIASNGGESPIPALFDDDWVPVMSDPVSREVWLRWLPRYAGYINENPIITGPSGSGKTRLAAAMHRLSGRTGPFVSITPRDFSSAELVQAELFGAVAGAYTGAVEKWGLVRKAEKGTLFIDELQSIDRDLQGKLITFIENKTYRRVGEAESHQADVRFVFATNRPLEQLVANGSLRDDFAYRLERLQLDLPPLEKRRLDISAALAFSLAKISRERTKTEPGGGKVGRTAEGFSNEAYSRLFSSDWPGNLRQLENTVAKLVEYADIASRKLVDRNSVDEALHTLLGRRPTSSADVLARAAIRSSEMARSGAIQTLDQLVQTLKETARAEAILSSGGDPAEAAELIHDSAAALQIFQASRSEG